MWQTVPVDDVRWTVLLWVLAHYLLNGGRRRRGRRALPSNRWLEGRFFAVLSAPRRDTILALNFTLVLRIEVRDWNALKLLLQISQSLVVRLRQSVGNCVQSFLSIIAWLPVYRAQHSVFGNGLERFEQSKCFEYTAANGEIIERDLQIVSRRDPSPPKQFDTT